MKSTITHTDEDFDSPLGDVVLEFNIEFNFTAGEKMIRYTKNGDGYPGSPDEIEILNCRCVSITPAVGEDRKPTAEELKLLNDWATEKYSENEKITERCCRQIYDNEQDCCDSSWDD